MTMNPTPPEAPKEETPAVATPGDGLTAEQRALLETAARMKFQRFLDEGLIVVDPDEPGKFIIARFSHDWKEALDFAEKFEMIHLFDSIKQTCFLNGMLDGIRQVRKVIAKAGSEIYRKPLNICDDAIGYLVSQAKTVRPATTTPALRSVPNPAREKASP